MHESFHSLWSELKFFTCHIVIESPLPWRGVRRHHFDALDAAGLRLRLPLALGRRHHLGLHLSHGEVGALRAEVTFLYRSLSDRYFKDIV